MGGSEFSCGLLCRIFQLFKKEIKKKKRKGKKKDKTEQSALLAKPFMSFQHECLFCCYLGADMHGY